MSSGYGKGGLFVDTGLLRDHVSKLRERKKTATRLYETVVAMKRMDDPGVAHRYNSVLREIQQLIEYFDRMAALLDNVSDDAVELSHRIESLLENSTDYTRRTISENFL